MKPLNPDLFPETLLVSHEGARIYTTSVHMAEHFGKRHDNVMKAIYKAISESPDEERLLNFEERLETYIVNNARRERRIFQLTHDGFMFVVQGFTGKEASSWKWKFIRAFRDMERQLRSKEERFATALDQIRPYLRPVVEATEQGLSRSAIATPLGKSPSAITYHRRQARRFGLIT